MTRKRLPPDDPREWLNRARSNLACAAADIPDAYLEDLCFNAQQCAEKAIKGVFVARGEKFPFVHDLKRLLTLLEGNGQKVPKYLWHCERLTSYAGVSRYPESVPPATKRDHRAAIRIATAVLR